MNDCRYCKGSVFTNMTAKDWREIQEHQKHTKSPKKPRAGGKPKTRK